MGFLQTLIAPRVSRAEHDARLSEAVTRAEEAESRLERVEEYLRVIANSPMLGMPSPGQQPPAGLGAYAFDRPLTFATPQSPNRRPGSLVSVDTLRILADTYDPLRAGINHLKREVAAVPLEFVAREEDDDSDKTGARIKEASRFFETPGGLGGAGRRRSHFESAWIDDLLVIGARCFYYRKTRGGGLYEVETIDAATIRPKVDPFGWPGPGEKVYQQWVYGVLVAEYDRTEMTYDGVHAASYSPYFKSPVEWILSPVMTHLKADEWNRVWLTDGNTPSDMCAVPDAWTPDEIRKFTEWFDDVNSGDSKARNRTKFVPSGTSRLGNPSRKDQDFQLFEQWLLKRTCYDYSMEVLTEVGWKKFSDLDRTERVATRSPSGQFEWQAPTDYIAYHYEGDMVHFKSSTVDCLVTPDHRMLSQLHHGPLSLVEARDLVGKECRFAPATSQWTGNDAEVFTLPGVEYDYQYPSGGTGHRVLPPLDIPTEDWVRFLGIWIAEGCTPKGGRGYRVTVSQQRSSPHFEEIRSLLERLPFRWGYAGHDFYTTDARLRKYLEQIGYAREKRIPRDVLDLSPRYLELLWDWLMMGDGSTSEQPGRQERRIYASNSFGLAGDVQELLQKCGRDGSIALHTNSGVVSNGLNGLHVTTRHPVYLVRQRQSPRRKLKGALTPYRGMVYCVTVPNSTLYVRRNGKPLWCGNCSMLGVHPASIGYEDGQYAVTQENSMDQTSTFGAGQILEVRKAAYDDILERLGYPDLECRNVTSQEEAANDRATRVTMLVAGAVMTPNEARSAEGLDSIEGGDELFVPTTLQPIALAINPPEPEASVTSDSAGGSTSNPASKASSRAAEADPLNTDPRLGALQLWQRKALNRMKDGRGRDFDFQSEDIDSETRERVRSLLRQCNNAGEIRAVFANVPPATKAELSRRWQRRREEHEATFGPVPKL